MTPARSLRAVARRVLAAVTAPCLLAGLAVAASDAPAAATVIQTTAHSVAPVVTGVTLTHVSVQIDRHGQRVYLIDVDLHSARLGVAVANNRVNSPGEDLMSMVGRTGAIAGVNGDIFNLTDNRAAYGGEIANGSIFKTPAPGPDQFVVQSNGVAAIAPVTVDARIVYFRTRVVHKKRVRVRIAKSYTSVNNVSAASGGALTLLTPALGGTALPAGCVVTGLAVTRKGWQVTRTYPAGTAFAQLPGNRRALLGCGAAGKWLRTALPAGTMVANFAVVHAVGSPSTVRVTTLVGGPQVLVMHGAAYRDTHSHWQTYGYNPETWVCVDPTGMHVRLGAVDGWSWSSSGVTLAELQAYLISTGCYNGLVLDGGGSTAVAALSGGRVQIQNSPGTGRDNLRPLADGLLVFGG